jgi:hypothetical protein
MNLRTKIVAIFNNYLVNMFPKGNALRKVERGRRRESMNRNGLLQIVVVLNCSSVHTM